MYSLAQALFVEDEPTTVRNESLYVRLFCRSNRNLTDEHVFPAFMGGKLEVRNGSCERCNGDFGKAEAVLKEGSKPLLNLLQIENRYNVVPNAALRAEIRGLDMRNLPAFMDGGGNIKLQDVVREIATEDGRLIRQGFFLNKEASDKFAERARAKGLHVIEREVPREIVIESGYTINLHFMASLHAHWLQRLPW